MNLEGRAGKTLYQKVSTSLSINIIETTLLRIVRWGIASVSAAAISPLAFFNRFYPSGERAPLEPLLGGKPDRRLLGDALPGLLPLFPRPSSPHPRLSFPVN